MSITVSVPSNIRRPLVANEFKHVPAGQALVAIDQPVALIGIKRSTGTGTTATPYEVFSIEEADAIAGSSSELSTMYRTFAKQCRYSGKAPRCYIVPVTAPAGVAAVQTLTVSITTATAGTIYGRVGHVSWSAGVASGDSANTIASTIKAAIEAVQVDLPITATVATSVVTCTQNHTGVTGNDLLYEIISVPAGVSIALSAATAGTGAIDITASLDALLPVDVYAIAIANHTSTDVTDATSHTAEAWAATSTRYRWVIMGEVGTVSTANALSTAANDKTVLVIGCERSPGTPGVIASMIAAEFAGTENPAANFDRVVLDLPPPSISYAFTALEIESGLAAGTTPLVPTDNRTRTQIVRLVTTKTTENSYTFEPLRDVCYPRVAAYRAKQITAVINTTMFVAGESNSVDGEGETVAKIRAVVRDVDKGMELRGYLTYVDNLSNPDQTIIEQDETIPSRIKIDSPFAVPDPLHQIITIHRHQFGYRP